GDARAPLLVVTPKPEHALNLFRQLSLYATVSDDVYHFPELEMLPFERSTLSLETRQKRLTALRRLCTLAYEDGVPIIVASAPALMQQTLAPTHFRAAMHTIRRDETHPLHVLLKQWQAIGYEPVTIVEQRGQFSHRGGIVDVWSPATALPTRIEFFG